MVEQGPETRIVHSLTFQVEGTIEIIELDRDLQISLIAIDMFFTVLRQTPTVGSQKNFHIRP